MLSSVEGKFGDSGARVIEVVLALRILLMEKRHCMVASNEVLVGTDLVAMLPSEAEMEMPDRAWDEACTVTSGWQQQLTTRFMWSK